MDTRGTRRAPASSRCIRPEYLVEPREIPEHPQLGDPPCLDFDQTELPGILRGLDAICEAVPVVGKP